jgi:hypothetical protein
MKLEFKFSRKETSKLKHLSMWFEVLFPNAIIQNQLINDNETLLTLYDETISDDANSYYYDNISIDTLLDGYPSFPSMTNWFYRMDSRTIWGSFKDQISSGLTTSHSSIELERPTDDDANEVDDKKDKIEQILQNLSTKINIPVNNYSAFRVIKSTPSDNVQLTSYDIKRIVATSLIGLRPSLSIVNTYNIDGYRTDINRQELNSSYDYVSPTLEITRTISSQD